MKLKCNDDVENMFFIFLEFSSKGSIQFNATFGQSPDEVLASLCKPIKPRYVNEIIASMCDKSL